MGWTSCRSRSLLAAAVISPDGVAWGFRHIGGYAPAARTCFFVFFARRSGVALSAWRTQMVGEALSRSSRSRHTTSSPALFFLVEVIAEKPSHTRFFALFDTGVVDLAVRCVNDREMMKKTTTVVQLLGSGADVRATGCGPIKTPVLISKKGGLFFGALLTCPPSFVGPALWTPPPCLVADATVGRTARREHHGEGPPQPRAVPQGLQGKKSKNQTTSRAPRCRDCSPRSQPSLAGCGCGRSYRRSERARPLSGVCVNASQFSFPASLALGGCVSISPPYLSGGEGE